MAEYALLIALVAMCLIGVLRMMRDTVGGSVDTVSAGVAESSTGSYGAASDMPHLPLPSYGGGTGSSGSLPDTGEDEDQDGEPPADSVAVEGGGIGTAGS